MGRVWFLGKWSKNEGNRNLGCRAYVKFWLKIIIFFCFHLISGFLMPLLSKNCGFLYFIWGNTWLSRK